MLLTLSYLFSCDVTTIYLEATGKKKRLQQEFPGSARRPRGIKFLALVEV